jgi:hypothetical protein
MPAWLKRAWIWCVGEPIQRNVYFTEEAYQRALRRRRGQLRPLKIGAVVVVLIIMAMLYPHSVWLWLLLIIPVGFWTLKALQSARADATRLIDSVVKNSLNNLGYEPDAASLMFSATHPFLSARIWRMLDEDGAVLTVGGPVDDDITLSCDRLLRYVRDKSFRERYPCAGALIQYAIYLCDRSPEQRYGCLHPKDQLGRPSPPPPH